MEFVQKVPLGDSFESPLARGDKQFIEDALNVILTDYFISAGVPCMTPHVFSSPFSGLCDGPGLADSRGGWDDPGKGV